MYKDMFDKQSTQNVLKYETNIAVDIKKKFFSYYIPGC